MSLVFILRSLLSKIKRAFQHNGLPVLLYVQWVCLFPVISVTGYPKLSGLKNRSLFFCNSGGRKSEVSFIGTGRTTFPPDTIGKNPFLASSSSSGCQQSLVCGYALQALLPRSHHLPRFHLCQIFIRLMGFLCALL